MNIIDGNWRRNLEDPTETWHFVTYKSGYNLAICGHEFPKVHNNNAFCSELRHLECGIPEIDNKIVVCRICRGS